MFKWLGKLFKRKKLRNETRDLKDNIDPDTKEAIITPSMSVLAPKLWYPKAIKYQKPMRVRGHYKNNWPVGAVIHFTAGRTRPAPIGSTRSGYPTTALGMGKKSMESAISDQAYAYLVNDQDGNIHQAHDMSTWGYHAGESSWPSLGTSLSSKLVGIENQSAGTLSKVSEGVYKAYFTDVKKGDKYFHEHEVRHIKTKVDHRQIGIYHKFTEAQEKSLIDLLMWLKHSNPSVFSFDNCLSHDEISPKRKNDIGGSLSMSMPEFRQFLKEEYKKRYE
tara:strand:- start:1178 stop:2005 length:828 start_codon:yes stop_codon:yes gene_type:complete